MLNTCNLYTQLHNLYTQLCLKMNKNDNLRQNVYFSNFRVHHVMNIWQLKCTFRSINTSENIFKNGNKLEFRMFLINSYFTLQEIQFFYLWGRA